MVPFTSLLVLATLLCGLVAGFLFAYAVVIMPGIKGLDAAQFLRAFQVTDRVIQDGQRLFMLVWLGSALALTACAVLGLWTLAGIDRLLLLVAAAAYLAGVQASTIILHLPLNNQLQQLSLDTMDEQALLAARAAFEPPWNRSNEIRTAIACACTLVLVILAARL